MPASSVGPRGPWHLRLRDVPTSPATEVGLVLDTDEQGNQRRIEETRAQPLPPRQSQGPLEWTHQDPLIDFVWAMNDWSGGALWPFYDEAHRNFYAQANGVDARWHNVLGLGPARNGPMDVIVRNGGAERGDTTGWSVPAAESLSVVTTAPRTGTYHFRLASVAVGHRMRQRLGQTNGAALDNQNGNPEVYRGTAIRVYAYARYAGGTSASARVNIVDSGGTTNGTTVVLTTSYQLLPFPTAHTVDSTATALRWEIEVTAQAGAPDVYVDDVFCVPAGGTQFRQAIYGVEELLYNGGAEINTTTGWVVSNADVGWTNVTTTPYEGSRHYRATTSVVQADAEITQAITAPTSYRSRTIVLAAQLYHVAGGASDTFRLMIRDSDGATYGTDPTAASYNLFTVTRACGSSITSLSLGFDFVEADATANEDNYADAISAYAIGPVDLNPNYAVMGRCVLKWDETADVWNAVYIHASVAATDIIEYNQQVLVAFGGGDTAYIYGTGTSWTPSVLTGDAKYAHFFEVVRQTLWKSRFDGNGQHAYIASSTAPFSGGSWSSEYTVGSIRSNITGLHSLHDTLVVGKQDGLFLYLRVYNDGASADLFQDITTEYRGDPDDENFAVGFTFKDRLYLTAAPQGLFFYDRQRFVDLSAQLISPQLTDFGGRVRAMTSDPIQLWMALDTPTADTSPTKSTWLMSLREEEGKFLIHTVEQATIGVIDTMLRQGDYLWSFGRLYDSSVADYRDAVYRWDMPVKNAASFADASPLINLSGTINLSAWHGGLPDTVKAMISCVIWCADVSSTRTVRVRFGMDGAPVSTSTLGTFSGTGRIQTLNFADMSSPATAAVGRIFQPELRLVTTDTTSPKLYGVAFHTVVVPPVKRKWTLVVRVGAPLRTGFPDPVSKTTLLANMSTLEGQSFPIQLVEDFDQNDAETAYYVRIREWARVVPNEEEKRSGETAALPWEIYRLVLQEV